MGELLDLGAASVFGFIIGIAFSAIMRRKQEEAERQASKAEYEAICQEARMLDSGLPGRGGAR